MGVNNVFGQVDAGSDGDGIVYLGTHDSARACEVAAKEDAQHRGPFTAWTYHENSFGGAFAQQCFGRIDGAWAPVPQDHVDSGQLIQQNVWQASLAAVAKARLAPWSNTGAKRVA